MNISTDILQLALRQPTLYDQLELAHADTVRVPGSFDFSLQRFLSRQSLPVEDVAIVVYQPATRQKGASIELRYCIAGNQYCNNPACKNELCAMADEKRRCLSRLSIEVIAVHFQPFLISNLQKGAVTGLFDGTHKKPFVKTIVPCTKSKLTLEQMVHHHYEGMLKNIYLQSKALELLLYSSDQFTQNDPDERFGCRFLTQAEDREKIVKARNILLERLDEPITIRELARKVAMNECYLKKGFKAMYGTSIYDYFQKERMEKARQLFYEQGLSVSEVAVMMGYSCISHFSTAFKKHTGIKPCELLLR